MDGQRDKGEVWGREGGKATEQRPLSQHHNSPPSQSKPLSMKRQSAQGQLVSACVLLSLVRTVGQSKQKVSSGYCMSLNCIYNTEKEKRKILISLNWHFQNTRYKCTRQRHPTLKYFIRDPEESSVNQIIKTQPGPSPKGFTRNPSFNVKKGGMVDKKREVCLCVSASVNLCFLKTMNQFDMCIKCHQFTKFRYLSHHKRPFLVKPEGVVVMSGESHRCRFPRQMRGGWARARWPVK